MGAARVVLVAALHVLEHLSAVLVAEVVSRSREVRSEESAERGRGRGTVDEARSLHGVGRSEQERSTYLEALHIGVEEVAVSHNPGALEGVASDEGGVGVI